MCRLNAKFALGQNVLDFFTNRIAGFFWGGEKRTLRVVLHTCVERLWSINNFSAAFRRLVVKD